ncbi:hypothetical protein CFC21_106835 [Triticum aestivum]|nr:hypothetical protein CFC21_106835 [Triticum aestivum]
MHTDTTTTTIPKATADDTKLWTTRNYILAALGGTLVVTAIIIIVSVVLGPAHISFYIVHASSTDPRASNDGTQYLNLTIAAANGSRKRAAVRYQSVFVDLKNSTSVTRRNTIHAPVYATTPPMNHYLPPGAEPASIKASALLLTRGENQDFIGRRVNVSGFNVVVTALVRFRIHGVPTRAYDIKVSCNHVFFPVEGPSSLRAPPINCTAY